MGLKLKAGLAFGGLVLSWAFGLNGLSGIATYVDSTGNILVDIADGIGLVSKGIEALENYLEPPVKTEEQSDTEPSPANIEPVPASTDRATAPSPTPESPPQPVICKRGKCAPYDPAKDRVLQQQLIQAERERILAQVQSGSGVPGEVVPRVRILGREDEDEEEDEFEEDDDSNVRVRRAIKKVPSYKASYKGGKDFSRAAAAAPSSSQAGQSRKGTAAKVEILDPAAPEVNVVANGSAEPQQEDMQNEVQSSSSVAEKSRWRHGFKRILGSVSGLCKRVSGVLLKFVATVFPWNRRARRRLTGEDEE